jgi:hypothetical protein
VDESREILQDEEQGVFLLRESSQGGYVVCLKYYDTDINNIKLMYLVRPSDHADFM